MCPWKCLDVQVRSDAREYRNFNKPFLLLYWNLESQSTCTASITVRKVSDMISREYYERFYKILK